MANGKVIYDGPSLLDGEPIIVVVTGLEKSSSNGKTGAMLQTWILLRDIDPREANKSGADYAICGDCPHRGVAHTGIDTVLAYKRACYVIIYQAPLKVWKTFQRGGYDYIEGTAEIADIGQQGIVRMGSYGDPAAVPAYVWKALLANASGHTGYSHQSDKPEAAFDADMFMVSADSLDHARNAWDKNQRTFRTIKSTDELVKGTEILCPASKEAGMKTNCANCKLCSGSAINAKSIAIVAHGNGAKYAT